MKKTINLFALIVLLQFVSCDRDEKPNLIPAGIQTRVSGKITSLNNENLSDIEIKIGEYIEKSTGGGGFLSFPGQTNYDYEFKSFVKSINLTSTGDFDFTFTTTGNGNFYNLSIGEFPQLLLQNNPAPFFVQKINDPLIVNLTEQANDRAIIGKEFTFRHSLKKLYLCEVNATFNLTNSYPLEIYHLLTYNFNNKKIENFSNPITIKLFIDKANSQTLLLLRNRNNGIKQKAEYIFPASNLETTTSQNIIVNENDFVDY